MRGARADALARLSLEQKVGQMFMLAFAGPIPADAAVLVREHHVGACYLSNDNFADPDQATALATALQGLALEGSGIPLLLGADQEGAWAVLTPWSCPGPGNMGLGAAGSPDLTRAMYRVFGEELRTVGLNLDLAPAADVNTNPQNTIIGMRSFGEQPGAVAEHVQAAIAGLHDAGVGATAKHFPGHGDTAVDTHRGLPAVDRPRASLEERELRPFRAAVASGVDVVMTAHIFFSALDRRWPATLSPAILTGLLRTEIGFNGVILTDSFNMGAVSGSFDPADAVAHAVRAGADMILLAEERYGREPTAYLEAQVTLVRSLIAAVRRGEVEQARIDGAVSRILALKEKWARVGTSAPAPRAAAGGVGVPDHRATERRAAEAAVVLVQDRRGLVPLRLRPEEHIVVASGTDPEGYRRMAAGRGIGPNVVERPAEIALREIQRRHARTSFVNVPPEDLGRAPALAEEAAVIVVVTEKFPLAGFDFPDESQHRFIDALLSARRAPVVVLGCRDPYEVARVSGVDAYISAMGYRAPSVAAAVQVLFGEMRARGRLPVSVPGLYPVGWSAAP
ncbi:MAG TPA: glycoside hydrolase family 3 N-terminal domain-containing protein [bacterium]